MSKRNKRIREKKLFEDEELLESQLEQQFTPQEKHKLENKRENYYDAHVLQGNVLLGEEYPSNPHQVLVTQEEELKVQSELPLMPEPRRNLRQRPKRERRNLFELQLESNEQKPSIHETEKLQQLNQQQDIACDDLVIKSQNKQDEEENSDVQAIIDEQKKAELIGVEIVMPLHEMLLKTEKSIPARKARIYAPLGPNEVSYAYIKRFKSGMSEYYQVSGDDERPAIFCENQRGAIGCNYYISLTKEMDKNTPAYLGKLRGNALGSTYHLYDEGQQASENISKEKCRKLMATIAYEANFLGMNGPRKLLVMAANLSLKNEDFRFEGEDGLQNLKSPKVFRYRNKQPHWNDKIQSYALNFGGRVKRASIKNFILVNDCYSLNSEQKADHTLVFGKVSESTFSVEYRYPLSLYQAFGIALSQFDYKIQCQ